VEKIRGFRGEEIRGIIFSEKKIAKNRRKKIREFFFSANFPKMDFQDAFSILQKRVAAGVPSDCCGHTVKETKDESDRVGEVGGGGGGETENPSRDLIMSDSKSDTNGGATSVKDGPGRGETAAGETPATEATPGVAPPRVEDTSPQMEELSPELYTKIIQSLDLIERDGQELSRDGKQVEALKIEPAGRILQLQGRRARVRIDWEHIIYTAVGRGEN
jgi:hypothetical protein